jgi:hypothetical protein
MRVLVCGGRDYLNVAKVWDTLDQIHAGEGGGVSLLIEGGATGADRLGRTWAQRRGVSLRTFNANWTKHGKAAGPIRNQRMLDEGKPDVVLAFPGGRGTADMVARAKMFGARLVEVE